MLLFSKYKLLGTCSTVIDIIFHCGCPLTYDFYNFRCEVVDNDYYYGDPPSLMIFLFLAVML